MADFTEQDPEIKLLLEQLNADQVGLPVLAIFPAEDPNSPIVFKGAYTQSQLVEGIRRAGPSAKPIASSKPAAKTQSNGKQIQVGATPDHEKSATAIQVSF